MTTRETPTRRYAHTEHTPIGAGQHMGVTGLDKQNRWHILDEFWGEPICGRIDPMDIVRCAPYGGLGDVLICRNCHREFSWRPMPHDTEHRVCGVLGVAAGDACQKPVGHDGPHEGAISAHATGSRAAKYATIVADSVQLQPVGTHEAGEDAYRRGWLDRKRFESIPLEAWDADAVARLERMGLL